MTFPVIAATNTSETTSNSTSHTVALPASIGAGNGLAIAIYTSQNVTFSLPSGWDAELVENSDANGTLWFAYKLNASGSEGASVVVTSSGTTNCAHASARWTGGHASAALEAGTVTVVGNVSSHDPSGVTPSWGAADTLFMALFGWRNSARTAQTYPTNYTDNQTTKSNSAGGNNGGIAFATRNLNATSDDPGALSLSASSVGKCVTIAIRPVAAKVITADAGSYAVSGQAATLKHGFKIAADAGSYSVAGQAATLKHGWKIAAGVGGYSLTGADATLTKGSSSAKVLSADAGSYVFTGQAAGLLHAWKTAGGIGSYALTGQAATLRHGWKIGAQSDSYAVTGATAQLIRARRVSADAGSYGFTGISATLRHARKIAAGNAGYSFTGSEAHLVTGGTVNMSFSVSGAATLSPSISTGASMSGSIRIGAHQSPSLER